MKSTLYIRVINGLIIPGLEYETAEKAENEYIALSAVTPLQKEEKSQFGISIERLTESLQIGFISESNDPAFKNRLQGIIKKNLKKTGFLLKMVTGKEIKSISLCGEEKFSRNNSYEYMLIIRGKKREDRVRVLLGNRFFNLFYPQLESTIQYNDILEEISPFFENPSVIQPRFETIIEDLPHEELSNLFNHMLKTSRLSPYEITALILYHPHLKGKIINSLSENIQKDIRFNINKYRGVNRITKKDSSAAVYSIEEALRDLLLKEKTGYSRELIYISEILKKIYRYGLYLKKDFDARLNEIEKNWGMEKVLPLCSDRILKAAFSDNEWKRKSILEKYLPQRRIGEIFAPEEKFSLKEKIEAEIEFITLFRKKYFETNHKGHESFNYLISGMHKKNDFLYLLSETGWMTLSTAMKGAEGKTADKILQNIPPRASMLIKDVLNRKLNPDILHDEKQIQKAGKICVDTIISLYNDCLIEMED
jgi:hypothetical protein